LTRLFTIGFTQTTAEHFFRRLNDAGVRTLIDTRINRDGQLSGFAKGQDLAYFVKSLTNARYRIESSLAPPVELLKRYRDKQISWTEYAEGYREILTARQPEQSIPLEYIDHGCLLCSEPRPERCHRSLAATYLERAYANDPDRSITITHL